MVELMFALVITGTLMGALYQIFFATTAQAYKVDAKYEAMKSALVASEVISREVDRLVTLPVEKDEDGKVQARVGDHARPLYVARDGRGVSFYVPNGQTLGNLAGEPADPLMISLTKGAGGGLYLMRRDQGPEAVEAALAQQEGGEETDPEDGFLSGAAPGTRLYRGVHLASLKFRLLSPISEVPALASPDDNFYLEVVIVGTDRFGKEQNALTLLKPLTFPSQRLHDPSVPAVTYTPLAPLQPPGVIVNPSPAEVDAAEEIIRISQEWVDGGLTPEQLVDQIRTALEPVSGTVPTGAIASTSPQIPVLPPDATVISPPGGPTVIGSPTNPGGPAVVLPPPPGLDQPPVISWQPQGEFIEWEVWGEFTQRGPNGEMNTGSMGSSGSGTFTGPNAIDQVRGIVQSETDQIRSTMTGLNDDFLAQNGFN